MLNILQILSEGIVSHIKDVPPLPEKNKKNDYDRDRQACIKGIV